MTLRFAGLSSLCLLLALPGAGCAPADPPADGTTTFTATLNGAAEVPAVVTNATGTGTFVLNAAKTELTVNVTASGLSSAFAAAHLHRGAAGVAGPVIHPITQVTTAGGQVTLTGPVWAPTPADVADLEAGNVYINIHTLNFPGGEIRGTLVAQ